jgi:hypothetical protein
LWLLVFVVTVDRRLDELQRLVVREFELRSGQQLRVERLELERLGKLERRRLWIEHLQLRIGRLERLEFEQLGV